MRGSRAAAGWFTLRSTAAGIELLDQRLLPHQEVYLQISDVEEAAQAIEDLAVRGAPAIGCVAALAVALAARQSAARDIESLERHIRRAVERLARTRPTAVNLFWALDCMRRELERCLAAPGLSVGEAVERLRARAERIVEEDVAACRAIGAAGAPLVQDGARILTHCNAGALATAGCGTALGVVRAAVEAGRKVSVFADETRPFLQGARLTAWELARDGIPVTVVTDSMAGHLMQQREVDLILVGADRIACNGDVANKIGTYPLAVLAEAHGVPFYVAAPLSSIDRSMASGAEIPIEERGAEEVAQIAGSSVVPEGVPVRYPAFDVTPARLVTAIVTERGVIRPRYEQSIPALFPC